MRRNRRSFMTCQIQDRVGTAMVANQKEFSPQQIAEWWCAGIVAVRRKIRTLKSKQIPPRLRLEKYYTSHPGIFRAPRRDITPFYSRSAKSLRRPCSTTNNMHAYRLFTHYTTMPTRSVLGSISGNIPRKKELTPLRTRYYCWEGFCQY